MLALATGLLARLTGQEEVLIAFFEARRGQLYGFRWKDWADYKSAAPSAPVAYTDQVIATGDGDARRGDRPVASRPAEAPAVDRDDVPAADGPWTLQFMTTCKTETACAEGIPRFG